MRVTSASRHSPPGSGVGGVGSGVVGTAATPAAAPLYNNNNNTNIRGQQQQRRRQYIAPSYILEQYGATAVVVVQQRLRPDDNNNNNNNNNNNVDDDHVIIMGIALHGWKITTWQGTIANEEWLERMTHQCELVAQPLEVPPGTTTTATATAAAATTATTTTDKRRRRRRRQYRKLNLPEMVFGLAHVTLEQQELQKQEQQEDEKDQDESNKPRLQLCWNTEQALMEWARAHESIPLLLFNGRAVTTTTTTTTTTSMETDRSVGLERNSDNGDDKSESENPTSNQQQETPETGVTILQSMDAALWNSKLQQTNNSSNDNSAFCVAETAPAVVVHYDWTYSTPYSGHVNVIRAINDRDLQEEDAHTNHDQQGHQLMQQQQQQQQHQQQQQQQSIIWKSLSSSGIKLELLTDQSVPILYYDEIILLEDDLHDNGIVQYSVKLRVMPQCVYILARLWLRVDQVMLRLRETRVLLELPNVHDDDTNVNDSCSTSSSSASTTTTTTTTTRAFPKIHRDVTWKQCPWKDLPKYSLPTTVSAWCGGGNNGSMGAGAGVMAANSMTALPESPEFRARLAQLPLQPSLPPHLCPHAVLTLL